MAEISEKKIATYIFCQLHIYMKLTLKAASPVSVSVSRLFGLTSCLAEPGLHTYVRELYSVRCTL